MGPPGQLRARPLSGAELASSGQRNITTFVHKRLAEQYVWMAEDLERRENLTQGMVTLLGRPE
jgi:hypothetical protein